MRLGRAVTIKVLVIVTITDAIIEMLGDESHPQSEQAHNLPPDKFYNPGSHISLKCFIRRYLIKNVTVQEITNVAWKKNEELIDLQSEERIRLVVQYNTVQYSTMQYNAVQFCPEQCSKV